MRLPRPNDHHTRRDYFEIWCIDIRLILPQATASVPSAKAMVPLISCHPEYMANDKMS